MSEKKPPTNEAHLDKPSEKGSEKHAVSAPITSQEDNALQLRAEKRQALSTFRLTKGDQQPFSIAMDNGAEVKDKRPIKSNQHDIKTTGAESPSDKSGTKTKNEKNDQAPEIKVVIPFKNTEVQGHTDGKLHPAEQTSQDKSKDNQAIETATASLIDGASRRFGAEKIAQMHISKEDVGLAMSALILGPGGCESLGADEARKLGKRLIVFGVAPVLGMSDEAIKHFSKTPTETAHEASGNILIGTAIGGVLEHINPWLTAAATTAGISMFARDQMTSPENRVRNKEVADISSKIDTADVSELIGLSQRAKKAIGPSLYQGAFTIATGGIGIPEGSIAGSAVKEEVALSKPKIDLDQLAKGFQHLSTDVVSAFEQFTNLGPRLQPALVQGLHDTSLAMGKHGAEDFDRPKASDYFSKMQGDASRGAKNPLDDLRSTLEAITKKSASESYDDVLKANQEILKLGKLPVPTKEFAQALSVEEDKLLTHVKGIRDTVDSLKTRAAEIQNKQEPTHAEEQLLDKFYSAEDTMYKLVTERMESQFGYDTSRGAQKVSDIHIKSGLGTQQAISNKMTDLFAHGLDKNQDVQNILKANGIPAERAKDWVGIAMPENSGADHAGCDYLLINKNTGELYPIDITEKTGGMRHGQLVESRLSNSNLFFPDKEVPLERKHLVIGVVSDLDRDNFGFRTQKNDGISPNDAIRKVDELEKKQLAELIGRTISTPSKLNIFDTPLPSSNPAIPESRQAYELWRLRTSLENLGYSDWARAITKSIGYLRSQNKNIPGY